jgi:hypothetical protein
MKILLFILVVIAQEFAFGQSSLDGKIFTITLKVSGKARDGIKWTKDELSFGKGAFTSKFMSEREKFPPFEYSNAADSASPGKIMFSAEGHNTGVSSIVWEGTVTGNYIEGIATWTNMNGPQKEIFKGSLKEK